ncbi:unnamed protein product [Acanthoscelides obtectus]|uniref:Uncharacterized protein n=1 Tax=Acanthoscelides obtectus TaxID=200917 RepID=A0A9P0QCA5_ACAOB|nr:unnamed protein product [Acanthoscelides obtectus]CAK1685918.1 hypothetical protein AOBTE_LOCUS35715 [Acanthoscelides obtectus]
MAAQAKIPVDTYNGEILIPNSKIRDCVIKETLTHAINGYALVDLENPSNTYQEISLYEPIVSFPFDANNYALFHAIIKPSESVSPLRHDLSKLIRTSHLSSKENAGR